MSEVGNGQPVIGYSWLCYYNCFGGCWSKEKLKMVQPMIYSLMKAINENIFLKEK